MRRLYNYAHKLNLSFWQRVVKNTEISAKSLYIFRVLTGLFLLFFYCPTYGWIGNMPQGFFFPPVLSVAIFFNGFLSQTAFIFIDLLILLCIVFITLGVRASLSTKLYCILSFFALSFQNSFGKIDHFCLSYVTLFILSYSGWGTGLALLPDKPPASDSAAKSISAVAVVICFAYFTAGYGKATHWVNFNFNKSGVAQWYYHDYYVLGRHELLATYVRWTPFWMFKILDYCAVIFEMTPLVCLLYSRKGWKMFLVVALIFHFIILLTFNISFISHIIVYLLFVDYSAWYPRILEAFRNIVIKYAVITILVIAVSLRVFYIFTLSADNSLFAPEQDLFKTMLAGLIVFILGGALLIPAFLKEEAPVQINAN